MNTKESFVLASLKEFVKLWGSGCQATFNLECRNGQAWFQLGGRLGHPAFHHYCPPPPQTQVKKKKSQTRVLKDRARAAEHRAKKNESSADPAAASLPYNNAAPADIGDSSMNLADPAGSPPPSSSPPSLSPSSESTLAAASAVPPSVTVTAVEESEISNSEVIETVHATAVVSNCPEETCNYQEIYGIIVKEDHMRSNIANIKLDHESTREFKSNLFTHTVSIIMTVKTGALWDNPRTYVWKHLGQIDWKMNNGTEIKFVRIHVK